MIIIYLKIYKAFIEFDKSDKTQTDIDKANAVLSNIYFYGVNCYSDDIIDQFLALMSARNIGYNLEEIINEKLPSDIRTNIAIPLWLVLKHPNVLEYAYARWSLGVNANYSIEGLSSFKVFEKHIIEATGNYWYFFKGSMSIDHMSSRYNLKAIMSFVPSLFNYHSNDYVTQTVPPTELYSSFELWSYEGIWNRLKYKKVLNCLDAAADELAEYYRNNYNLEKYGGC